MFTFRISYRSSSEAAVPRPQGPRASKPQNRPQPPRDDITTAEEPAEAARERKPPQKKAARRSSAAAAGDRSRLRVTPLSPTPCLDIVFSAFGSASQSAELSSQKLIYAGGDAIEDAVPTTVNVDKTAIVATAEPLHDSTNVANNVEARQEAAKKIHEFGNSPRRTNAEPAGGNEDVGKQANELPAPLSDDVQPADDNKGCPRKR
eukprot:gene17925-24319_t